MRSIVMAALAALGVYGAASQAEAAHGSGTITFSFTSFSGPFGATQVANLGDMSKWLLVGSANGQIPTPDGVNGPAGPGFLYPGGPPFRVGDRAALVPGYAPTAVNLYGAFNVVEDGTVVDRWFVRARHGEP